MEKSNFMRFKSSMSIIYSEFNQVNYVIVVDVTLEGLNLSQKMSYKYFIKKIIIN